MGDVVPMFAKKAIRSRSKDLRRSRHDLCLADFRRSGFDLTTADKLGIRMVNSAEIWAALHPKRPASDQPADFTVEGWLIPYYGPDGKPLNYFRIRALRGNWSAKESYKDTRYKGPPNSIPHLYVPWPLMGHGYDATIGKVLIPGNVLVGTEGEKKAIKACLSGIPCFAVGGVDSAGASKHGIVLSDDFKWFDWPNLDAEICFDSDAYNNASVNQSMNRFAYRIRRELHPRSLATVRLTSENAEKQALDDLLAMYDTNPGMAQRAFAALERIKDPLQEAFAHFNSQLIWIRKKTRYYNTATETFYETQTRVIPDFVGPTVVQGKKAVLPITLWFSERQPTLTTVTDVVYAPGRSGRFKLLGSDEYDTLNTWRPGEYANRPRKNSKLVKPFIEFVDYLTPQLDEGQRETLLDWCAYPLQRPGAKMDFAVIIVSKDQGTGKNTLAKILRRGYGIHNVSEIKGSSLASAFNEYALKQLVIVNEVHAPTYGERMAVMDGLKNLITEDLIDLRRMYLPRENVPNHANLYLTSNHTDALTLDPEDRRFFVIRGPEDGSQWTKERFLALYQWLDEEGGYEAVYRYLLARDLDAFNPHMDAPRTLARDDMIHGARNALDDLVEVLYETPDQILEYQDAKGDTCLPVGDLFRPQFLVEAVLAYAKRKNISARATVATLRSAMSKHPFVKKVFDIQINGERRSTTVYALRNVKRWKAAKKAAWREEWRRLSISRSRQ